MEPQVIVTEMFPFGRRAFRGELLPLLEAARACAQRPLVVASVRDVLVSKADPTRYRWMVETCLAHYDRVLVHGDERLLPFVASFPPAAELGERVVHTGFVHPGGDLAAPRAEAPPAVLVSAGGGAVGERLLRPAIARPAADPCSRRPPGCWSAAEPAGRCRGRPARRCSAARLHAGALSRRPRALMGDARSPCRRRATTRWSRGSAAEARMVLVPFAAGGEDEQEQRARRLQSWARRADRRARADRRVWLLAIDRIAAHGRVPRSADWAFDGAERSAEIVTALVAGAGR